MTNFSIFSDDHLRAAEFALDGAFRDYANRGDFAEATEAHMNSLAVRAELERRAIANIQSGKAA